MLPAELAGRRVAEAGRVRAESREFAGMSRADLEAERDRREGALEDLRAQCLQAEIRVVERYLEAVRAELARRPDPGGGSAGGGPVVAVPGAEWPVPGEGGG
jgi:hypothetical protein